MTNDAFCMQVLERLLNQILRVRSQFQEKGSWFLLHDSVAVHSTVLMKPRILRSVVMMKSALVVPQLWYFVIHFFT